jgi:hypothetical protein
MKLFILSTLLMVPAAYAKGGSGGGKGGGGGGKGGGGKGGSGSFKSGSSKAYNPVYVPVVISMSAPYNRAAPVPSLTQVDQISVDGQNACRVDARRAVYCTTNVNADSPVWNRISKGLVQIDVDGDIMCGVEPKGTGKGRILCSKFNENNWFVVEGSLKQISVSKGRACGVNDYDEPHCTSNIFTPKPVWQKMEDDHLKQIDLDGNKMCGVNSNGETYCAEFGKNIWIKKSVRLQLVSISEKTNIVCGLNGYAEVFCGDIDKDNLNKVPGSSLNSISVSGRSACGVNYENKLHCTSDILAPNPDWKSKRW